MYITKKRVLSFSAACTVLFSALTLTSQNVFMTANAEFEKTASETVKDMGFGWNLGNSLDSYSGTVIGSNIGSTSSETAWGNPATTKVMIDMVKDSGVETVRVPVTWYEHMDPNTYQIDEVWMDRVEEVVNYVLEDDMYCIINVHHDTGEKGWLKATSTDLEKKEAMFTAIWEQVSENFADYGDKLLFEGYNEILDGSANQWWIPSSEACPISNELNQIFVDTVRKSGGNNDKRNLIVNTYCAGANTEITSQFVLPNDTISNKLIVQAHVYQPFEFTSESYPDVTTWTSSSLDMVLNNIYSTFVQKGIPVIVGEFGCANKNNMDQITSWAKYLVESCTNKGIGCIWWDNGDLYKIYNRRTLTVAEPDLLNTMIAAVKGEVYTPDTTIYGDANGDGKFSIADAVALQKYLLGEGQLSSWKSADMNNDNSIDVFDLCIMKRNLCSGENLCADADNWSSWVDQENGADADVDYLDNGMSVTVRNGGSNDWDVQFAYQGLTLEQGAEYKLSFDYSSDTNQDMMFHVMQNYGDYMPYFSDTLSYSSNVQHYESTFTMTDKTDNNVEISFNCGGSSVSTPFNIKINNLKLIKVSGGTVSTPDEPVVTDSENLCADAGNWSSWINEEGGAAATVSYLENGIKINVTNSGAEEWYIQGSYPDITLEQGAKYQISFDYSADKNISLWYHVQQNYDPYGQYLYESLDYTTETQHYSTTFTMTEPTDKNAVCVFNFGGADENVPFNATITNLSLVRIS